MNTDTFSAFRAPGLRIAYRMTPLQAALLRALADVLPPAGLRVVCTRCAEILKTADHLVCDNQPDDVEWRADCPCTTRRIAPAEVVSVLKPTGRLIADAPDILAGSHLAIRCPIKATSCLWTPLTVTDSPSETVVRCQCQGLDLLAGVYRYQRKMAQGLTAGVH